MGGKNPLHHDPFFNWVKGVCMSSTGHDGVVAKSLANGLGGTGFTSQYWLKPRMGFLKAQWVGVRPLHPLL